MLHEMFHRKSLGEKNNVRNERQKTKHLRFRIEKYQMANLDVFQWNISSSINLFFLKSEIHS